METINEIIQWAAVILGGLVLVLGLVLLLMMLFNAVASRWMNMMGALWAFVMLMLSRRTRAALMYGAAWRKVAYKECTPTKAEKMESLVVERVRKSIWNRVRRFPKAPSE